jgi:hypothetical protein
MIRTVFNPDALVDPAQQDWWEDWLKRADRATGKAIDAFEDWLAGPRDEPFRFKFNNAIWKDLKDWLKEHVFYERCAYCERQISGYYGDAEHFRPKGAVLCQDAAGALGCPDCEIVNPIDGQPLTLGHPGYFWLAYDWRNLLPSCVYCNSGEGKNERFDVSAGHLVLVKLDQSVVDAIDPKAQPRPSAKWPGYYYLSPTDLDEREQPLLLNPLNCDDARNPHRHIRFGVRGIIAAVDESPLGLNTIEVFKLKDDKLRQQRQKAQSEFQDKFYDTMRRYDPDSGQRDANRLLEEFSQGRYPFCGAVLDFYDILRERFPPSPRR